MCTNEDLIVTRCRGQCIPHTAFDHRCEWWIKLSYFIEIDMVIPSLYYIAILYSRAFCNEIETWLWNLWTYGFKYEFDDRQCQSSLRFFYSMRRCAFYWEWIDRKWLPIQRMSNIFYHGIFSDICKCGIWRSYRAYPSWHTPGWEEGVEG